MTENGRVLEYQLKLDEEKSKELRKGKKMYKDEDGHRWYFTADEASKLEGAQEVTLQVHVS